MITSRENWALVDVYADEGITGTSARKRDDFQRMLDDCCIGKIDKILVKSISRFARNTTDCLDAIRELKAMGISVFFEEQNIDTKMVSSEMLTAVIAACAQAESESISRNMRWGVQKRMEQDIMKQTNMVMLLGNHECMMLQYFGPDVTSEQIRRWNRNGNTPTKQAYLKLKAKEQRAILEYLWTLPTHLEVTVNGTNFYLVHGFPAENVHDEVWHRPEIDAPNPKSGYQVIIGHTKVLSLIQSEEEKIAFATDLENRGEHLKIYHGPGLIDIDCGCGYDMPIKTLACIRLEDMVEYYA